MFPKKSSTRYRLFSVFAFEVFVDMIKQYSSNVIPYARMNSQCVLPPHPEIATTIQVPCIAHQDGPDLPLLPAALADPGLTYVVVTSPEAAKVFLSGWSKAGNPSVSVACVGKATGDALRAKGVTPAFTPSKATGETLAAEIPLVPPSAGDISGDAAAVGAAAAAAVEGVDGAEVVGGSTSLEEKKPLRVLYPASAKAQKTVETGLQARGFEVRRLNTYDTVPATWDETAGAAAAGAAVAAFGSPSAVKTWAARVGVATNGVEGTGGEDAQRPDATDADATGTRGGAGRALAACIGETSARACREAGWPESTIFYPEKPGMEGWAKAVGDALAAAENASSSSSATVATALA